MDKVIFRGKADPNGSYGLELNKALEECAGKAVLVIEKGVYPTGPIDIPSHTRLVLEEGAELSFIPDFTHPCYGSSLAFAGLPHTNEHLCDHVFIIILLTSASLSPRPGWNRR